MAGTDDSRSAGATRSDDELLALAKEHVGSQFGLSAQQAARLRGATKAEIEADAKAMRNELGLESLDEGDEHGERSDRDRDAAGRFAKPSTMNRLIRRASGRPA